jgi:hypothetical protein
MFKEVISFAGILFLYHIYILGVPQKQYSVGSGFGIGMNLSDYGISFGLCLSALLIFLKTIIISTTKNNIVKQNVLLSI